MDQGLEASADPIIVVTGLGAAGPLPCDPGPHLKVRKNRKMMGPQDDLAVVAAGQALASARLDGVPPDRIGLYAAVGYIPFEESEIELLLQGSLEGGKFSMKRFSTDGYNAVNPLLTFRCLSNMPAYHVSVNFDIQGPYFVTYPGPGQFYVALEEARAALGSCRIDVALVLGVAHQQNYLVRHHFRRVAPPVTTLSDAAGCLVLERDCTKQPLSFLQPAAQKKEVVLCSRPVRARLLNLQVSYNPGDPFESAPDPEEIGADASKGPASLPVALATAGPGRLTHRLRSRDGIVASSVWSLPP